VCESSRERRDQPLHEVSGTKWLFAEPGSFWRQI
jgi:hypothetical protein